MVFEERYRPVGSVEELTGLVRNKIKGNCFYLSDSIFFNMFLQKQIKLCNSDKNCQMMEKNQNASQKDIHIQNAHNQ